MKFNNPIPILFLPPKFEQNIIIPLRLDVDVELMIFDVNVFIFLLNYLLFENKYLAKIKKIIVIAKFL